MDAASTERWKMTATWRKEPPTPAEVREHQWWWARFGNTGPHILQLDLESTDPACTVILDIHSFVENVPLIPGDWGDEWAPCLPPLDREYVSRDLDKLRDAQRAVDAMPDGPGKEAVTFAVIQWMHAAFIDHRPLTGKDLEWVKDVAARYAAGDPALQAPEKKESNA